LPCKYAGLTLFLIRYYYISEKIELFSCVSDNVVRLDFQNIKSDGFGKGSALSGNDDVAFLDGKAGGGMAGDVFVSFLETFVLGHVMQVISPDDTGFVHLGRNDHAPLIYFNVDFLLHDSATD